MVSQLTLFGLTAATEAPQAASPFTGIIMMVVMFLVFYLILIRPQKKKEKEIKLMRENLGAGDEVVTIGGIHGKVVKVNDEVVILELPHAKQRVTFAKWAIGTVEKKAKDAKAADTAAIEESKVEESAEATVEENTKNE